MPQPPALPVDEKVRIVLSILAGEMTVAQAARRARKLPVRGRGRRLHRGGTHRNAPCSSASRNQPEDTPSPSNPSYQFSMRA